MRKRDTVDFVGLRFDRSTMAEAVDWLRSRAAGDAFGYVVTPNVDHVVQIDRDPAQLRPLYENADRCLCDSRVLKIVAHLTHRRLDVVPGSDLVVALLGSVLHNGDRVCLIGGRDALAQQLRTLYPGIIFLHHIPPMGLRHDGAARQAAIAFTVAANARFTLIAVGCPQQELLAHEMKQIAGAKGTALCIGAAIDFIVGVQIRAPRIVQRASLEWLWRLAESPKRLGRRYLVDGPRIFLITLKWWRIQRDRRGGRNG